MGGRKTRRYKGLGNKRPKKAKIEAVVALPNVVEFADALPDDDICIVAEPYTPETGESIHKPCADRTVDPVIGRRMAMAYFYYHIDHAPPEEECCRILATVTFVARKNREARI